MIVLAACSEEVIEPNPANAEAFDGSVTFCADVPALYDAKTRAFGDEADLKNMDIYAYEFEWGESYASRFLHAVHKGENVHTDGDGIVKFTLKTLETTDEHRVIHFIAMPKGTTLPDISDYNTAATVLPRLYAGGVTDLYGGRVEFSKGYSVFKGLVGGIEQWVMNDDIKKYQTTPIPLLRNFAKISVNSTAANFTLEGFAVVNTPTEGSAEPWHTDSLHVCDFRKENGTLKTYQEMANAGYNGYMPTSTLQNYDAASLSYTAEPKYMYERPFTSHNRTYVIVKGKYNNGASTYYKLDIGNEDAATSSFKYFNILRNFEYKINITRVTTDGQPSAEAAANSSLVYNNQIASVEAEALSSISDGRNLITTNKVNHVFTTTDPYTFKFSYSDLSPALNRSSEIQFQIAEGNVVQSWRSWDEGGYKYLEVTPKTPSDEPISQSIIAYVPGGLSKKIEVVLSNPFSFTNVLAYRGAHNDKPDGDDDVDKNGVAYVANQISNKAGEAMTLYFNLPKGLPSSVFPIEIYLESYEQEIENDKKLGTMVVQSGNSIYDDINDTRISYKRTVTQDEYEYYISTADPENPKKVSNDYHTVMCRFSFIKAAEDKQTSHIRIESSIFKDYDFSFARTDSCPTENQTTN